MITMTAYEIMVNTHLRIIDIFNICFIRVPRLTQSDCKNAENQQKQKLNTVQVEGLLVM